ncbi:hypothetical protein [Tardiphaga sp. 862_B3_N1_1]|uniref:hypothetical protein n=1 Tax=Tardiphaga sp. 862_B3_N1_1 TaxID=3240763 RepID=UPI003F8BE73B
MALVADTNGVVRGKFTIPGSIPAGAKNVAFVGQGGSTASASFFGQGTLEEDIRTLINQITTTRWWVNLDPIAQTFTVNQQMQIDGLDLFFTAVGNTDVSVQIRATQVGFPTQEILADARLKPSQITAGQWTKFTFPTAARLDANIEYAIVVLCNDAVSELAVAELGKFDANKQQWVTSQPYTVGVLLNSSNASTWTAYQDRDLAFRLYAREYTQTERVVDMGVAPIAAATDLLLRTMLETPTSAATGQIELTLPDGRVAAASDNQTLRFSAPLTGDVAIKARLKATQYASAALHPGTQLIEGHMRASATYISQAIDADAAGSTVRVIVDGAIPSGATIAVHYSGVDAGDTWVAMNAFGAPKLIEGNEGFYEYQFRNVNVMEARVRVRIVITGTPAARARLRNFRLFTL